MQNKDFQNIFFLAKKPATSHCYDFAIRSLWSIKIQIERNWNPNIPNDDSISPQKLILIDIHFLFISIRNLYRHLNKVIEDPTYQKLSPDLEILNKKWFKHYSKGREAFEHIDQRLPGEKHENKIVEVEENSAKRKVHYGLSMKNASFTHSDQSWDISKNKFKIFTNDVELFLKKINDIGLNENGKL